MPSLLGRPAGIDADSRGARTLRQRPIPPRCRARDGHQRTVHCHGFLVPVWWISFGSQEFGCRRGPHGDRRGAGPRRSDPPRRPAIRGPVRGRVHSRCGRRRLRREPGSNGWELPPCAHVTGARARAGSARTTSRAMAAPGHPLRRVVPVARNGSTSVTHAVGGEPCAGTTTNQSAHIHGEGRPSVARVRGRLAIPRPRATTLSNLRRPCPWGDLSWPAAPWGRGLCAFRCLRQR